MKIIYLAPANVETTIPAIESPLAQFARFLHFSRISCKFSKL